MLLTNRQTNKQTYLAERRSNTDLKTGQAQAGEDYYIFFTHQFPKQDFNPNINNTAEAFQGGMT